MKSPRELGLPYDSWRPGQQLALRTVQSAKTPHVLVQAPTGSGKSTIAAALPKLLPGRWATLTATKGLMRQYAATFPSLYPVMGLRNYECLAARQEFRKVFSLRKGTITCDEGPCHTGAACSLKDAGCLYFDRRKNAIAHRTPLTNYAYWLSQRRYARGLGAVRGLVCDESHSVAEQLMAAFRLELSKVHLDGLTGGMPKTHKEWKAWALHALESLRPGTDDDARLRRSKLLDTLKGIAAIDSTWQWDEGHHTIVFEPTVPRLLLPLLETPGTGTTIVHLSATASVHTLAMIGIPEKDITVHVMRSRFPVVRRPIYLVPGARMRYGVTDRELASWLASIDAIIGARLDRNGLIHAISFKRQQWIREHSRWSNRLICPTAKDLEAHLQYFQRPGVAKGQVLVSPSIMTGYDFPGEQAEYQIVAKIPFPDTSSRIMKARIAATPGYRDHLTMQSLEQACGRINRSADDSGETFIVDEMAGWFIEKYRHLASPSFLAAIYKTRSLPPPLAKL